MIYSSITDSSASSRDAETYERADNVCVKCLLAGVKFEPNVTLFCRKSELCRNFALFGVIFLKITFWMFMSLFGIFFHYLGLLGFLQYFIAN